MTSEPPAVLAYSQEIVPPLWIRLLLRPLGWPYFGGLVLACLCFLWEQRLPESIPGQLLAVMIILGFGGYGLFRVLLRAWLCRRHKKPWRRSLRQMAPLAALLLLAMASFYLGCGDLPERAAFHHCMPEMQRLAEDILLHPPAVATAYPPRAVGLGITAYIQYEPADEVVYFFIENSGTVFDSTGWAYAHKTLPQFSADQHYGRVPYTGNWYRASTY